MSLFQAYPWPGNVRELRGVVKEATLRVTGRLVLPECLPPELHPSPPPASDSRPVKFDLGEQIDALLSEETKGIHGRIIGLVERELLLRVLRHTHGHQGQACDLLGIDRKTLRNKIRELGLVLDKIVTERQDSQED
jgi:two-component system nitrogen regulation response regulator GlnG